MINHFPILSMVQAKYLIWRLVSALAFLVVVVLTPLSIKANLDDYSVGGYSLSITRAPESDLLIALENVQRERLDQAQTLLESLVQENPDFRLAQLVYADVLAARAGTIQGLGAGLIPETELAGLEDEARRRWLYHQRQPNGRLLPSSLVALGENEPYALVVDLELSRMYVVSNRGGIGPRVVDDYYISGGKGGPEKHREGDQRTPLGVYFTQNFIPGQRLPKYYGWGAFTLDYPNPLDRRLGKTGHGIWLHGNPTGMFSRPPLASDGCVTMHNKDLEALAPLLKNGNVPVVLSRSVSWTDPLKLREVQKEMLDLLETWRRDWESLNSEAYLAHYSPKFRSGNQDYSAWKRHKTRINAGKSEVRVRMGNINIFEYPENPEIMVATFNQDYWSDNFQSSSRKHQFWQQESDGRWRIIYEGSH
ncbi:Murein L,D-transpeptidase YafK [Desulfonatronum thiosulfatophilum]|uniref:Murein L,D-transpeptidase YafK n=1 Tax=Desulfonatronum thiosulfatophilum TaxID=617002 RepID=A0A1G6DI07_9BACT|nr:L,D-transpeptidase family protein [Desulfonatronum thiosulfatophilum]SDB44804.1 Murein L,D-transpeptidase YafK [Desulfonatronum thiosulfatophilum]